MVLTFNDTEEKAVEKIITTLVDSLQLEHIQPRPLPFFWSIDSEGCQSSVANVIYSLRKKIVAVFMIIVAVVFFCCFIKVNRIFQ